MNALFEKAGEGFGQAKINWVKDDVRLILLDMSLYKVDLKKDESLADIPKAARVAVSPPLTGKGIAGFVCDAEPIALPRVTGPLCRAAVLVQMGVMDKFSRLILFVDEAEFLPFLPNGGDLIVEWPTVPTKIFRF